MSATAQAHARMLLACYGESLSMLHESIERLRKTPLTDTQTLEAAVNPIIDAVEANNKPAVELTGQRIDLIISLLLSAEKQSNVQLACALEDANSFNWTEMRIDLNRFLSSLIAVWQDKMSLASFETLRQQSQLAWGQLAALSDRGGKQFKLAAGGTVCRTSPEKH